MEMNFCRRCGSPLAQDPDQSNAYNCEQGHTIYVNPAPVCGIFFVEPDNKHVLMSVRGVNPGKGKLDTFGGFLDGRENSLEAAYRELREELGLEPTDYEPLQYLTTAAGDYAVGNEDTYITGVFFWSRLHKGVIPEPQDDVAGIRTINIHDVSMDELMHASEIQEALMTLRQVFPKV